jgi:hypothetical protein
MTQVITIQPFPATEAQPAVAKYKLGDNTGVLHTTGTPKNDTIVTYDDREAALTAAQTLFAVGQFYNGQRIQAVSVKSDRLELTVGE